LFLSFHTTLLEFGYNSDFYGQIVMPKFGKITVNWKN